MRDIYVKTLLNLLQGREIQKYNNQEHFIEAAVAMILRKSGIYSEALFIKRSQNHRDVFSGHMALPGGKRGYDDKSLIDTVIRETSEEVGIDLNNNSIRLGELDDCKPNNPKARNLVVTPFIYYLKDNARVEIDNYEVSDYVWIPVIKLYEQYVCHLNNFGAGYNKLKFEYTYEDYFIWGLTGRIITQFMELTSHLYDL